MYHSTRSSLIFSAALCLSAGPGFGQAAAADSAVVRGAAGLPDAPLRQVKTELRTAMISAQPKANGSIAGVNTVLLAEAKSLLPEESSEVALTQPVPLEAVAMLEAAVRHMQKRHRGWPKGRRIELSFADPVSAADVPAAGLAVALTLDAIIEGWRIEPTFSAIGAIREDGEFVPVRHSIPRLLAAMRSGATRIAVPERMVAQVADMLVSEGVAAFVATQVFTVTSFDEAPGIASEPAAQPIARAQQRFAPIQARLQAAGAAAEELLKAPELKDALREVLTISPSHLTARLLLGRTTGQFSKLSLEGSLSAIEVQAATLLKAARSRQPSDLDGLPATGVQAEGTRLRTSRARLNEKAQPLIDALVVYSDVALAWHVRPASGPAHVAERNRALYEAAKMINDELARLQAALPK
jgi:hypothetical protein